jgi:hypothetical protein
MIAYRGYNSRRLYSYRRRHAKYRCRRRSLSCTARTRKRERPFFAHMCRTAILLCIDFTSDTAAPAGRVNIDVLYIHRFVCTSGPKRQQFVQRQYNIGVHTYLHNIIIYCIPTYLIDLVFQLSFCNR